MPHIKARQAKDMDKSYRDEEEYYENLANEYDDYDDDDEYDDTDND